MRDGNRIVFNKMHACGTQESRHNKRPPPSEDSIRFRNPGKGCQRLVEAIRGNAKDDENDAGRQGAAQNEPNDELNEKPFPRRLISVR